VTAAMMIWYLLTGIFAGTMSGLLGLGGGIVVVPVLAAIFLHNSEIPFSLHMHMAIGTSLAIMIITLASSAYAHNKHGTIHWPMVKAIFPGLVVGVVLGAIFIRFISSEHLTKFFGVFLMMIALRLLWAKSRQPVAKLTKRVRNKWLILFSLAIGILSSLLGVGGGMLWIPFFLYDGLEMHEALGTSVACGMVAALAATFSFLMVGMFSATQIPYSTSFIYWPAFMGVAVMSVVFAPVGAAIAYKLPSAWLKYIFAVILLLMAIQMMFFAH
jgi:uncharacterized membrane protein YfcA